MIPIGALVSTSLGGLIAGTLSQPPGFLALGDSYTIGESVSAEERWPVQLHELLRARGIRLAAPRIIARTGWTTDELGAALDADPPAGGYALVTLLIGVNNQYRGRSVESYRPEFTALLDRAIQWAEQHPAQVLVLSIPDWGVTPFARTAQRDSARVATEIDAYNAAARDITLAHGAHWIDITGLTREAAIHPELLAADGLHPSGVDYQRWAQTALPIAEAALAHLRQTTQGR